MREQRVGSASTDGTTNLASLSVISSTTSSSSSSSPRAHFLFTDQVDEMDEEGDEEVTEVNIDRSHPHSLRDSTAATRPVPSSVPAITSAAAPVPPVNVQSSIPSRVPPDSPTLSLPPPSPSPSSSVMESAASTALVPTFAAPVSRPSRAPVKQSSRKRKAIASPPLPSFLVPPLFSSSEILVSGCSPFEWLNTVDRSSPLSYYHRIKNVYHPTAKHDTDLLADIDWSDPAAEADEMCCDCDESSGCAADTCACARQSPWRYKKRSEQLLQIKVKDPNDGDDDTPSFITECNSRCKCATYSPPSSSSSCHNRVVQTGPVGSKCDLLVFRTVDRGWGVLTQKDILPRQYVCEYIGEVITDHLAEVRGDGTYYFNIDATELTGDEFDIEPPVVDAKYYGHISRFINHSCEPNLDTYQVQIEGRNPLCPHFAFFAQEKIERGQELTFNYGYQKVMLEKTFNGQCKCPKCSNTNNTTHN